MNLRKIGNVIALIFFGLVASSTSAESPDKRYVFFVDHIALASIPQKYEVSHDEFGYTTIRIINDVGDTLVVKYSLVDWADFGFGPEDELVISRMEIVGHEQYQFSFNSKLKNNGSPLDVLGQSSNDFFDEKFGEQKLRGYLSGIGFCDSDLELISCVSLMPTRE